MRQKLIQIILVATVLFGTSLFLVAETPPENKIQVDNQTPVKDEIQISLAVDAVVGKASYRFSVPDESSVYDAMDILTSTTSFSMTPFSFRAKHFSGLGYFVEQINGVENSNGTYWTLYINGVYSAVGASGYRLRLDDDIEWRFEKK